MTNHLHARSVIDCRAGTLTDATTLALLEDLLVQFRDEISSCRHRENFFSASRTA